MTTTNQLSTADELLGKQDDGFRYELREGELHQMSPAGGEHGDIAAVLCAYLTMHVRTNRLGKVYAAETGFKLRSNPDTVRAPDVAFIRQARVAEMGRVRGFLPGAPDLAVEVISPGDTYNQVTEKVFEWLEGGTRLVIVVNPDRRLVMLYRSPQEIRMLTEADSLDGGDVVPGWRLPVAELFS